MSISDNVERRILANRQRATQAAADDLRIRPVPQSVVSNPKLLDRTQTEVAVLQRLWNGLIPLYPPHVTTIFDWVEKFGAPIVEIGIRRTAEKARKKLRLNELMTPDDAARYCAAVMRNAAQNGAENTKEENRNDGQVHDNLTISTRR